ncbi:hypothetical protein MASR1M42_03650 [Azonexus hydrophilus]
MAAFDEVVLYQDACQRGRADGEVINLLRDGLKNAKRVRHVEAITGEFLAIDTALARLQSGDLCLILIDQVEEAPGPHRPAHCGKHMIRYFLPLAACLAGGNAHAYEARELLEDCRAAERFYAGEKTGGDTLAALRSGRCIAYVAGFADGYAVSDYHRENRRAPQRILPAAGPRTFPPPGPRRSHPR